MEPFSQLNRRIAAINQAEIQEVSLMGFLKVFEDLGFKTLGDISRLITDYWESAYQIACYQMGLTDLDIISSTIGPQNLCFAYILKNGGGKPGIKRMLDTLGGESESNAAMAAFVADQANGMPFMNQ